MTALFGVAAACALAFGVFALALPLFLQEALSWAGGRGASVRLRSEPCTNDCTAPGARLQTVAVELAPPTLWSQHSGRLVELRARCVGGDLYVLPLPPTQFLRSGDAFTTSQVGGQQSLHNCTTGVRAVLPRRLIKESSALGQLSFLPLLLLGPLALLGVFAATLGMGVARRVSVVSNPRAEEDLAAMQATSTDLLGTSSAWLLGLALLTCLGVALASSAPWPKSRRITADGRLLDA